MNMNVFMLGKEPVFPPINFTSNIGLLAIGGDLSYERLVNAYTNGIFPWYSKGEPILWWSPNPRCVLFPRELHVSKSMKRLLNKNPFDLTCDKNFKEVIGNCAKQRKSQKETWITDDMVDAYFKLHKLGLAHSVEVWQGREIVAGLYGVSLGKCFFGESMFYKVNNASKFGFIIFVKKLQQMGFLMIDCQINTGHLKSLGAREIPRIEFMEKLKECLEYRTLKKSWSFLMSDPEF